MNKGLISTALISAASAILDGGEAFDASMKCGKCIKNGYNYCHQGTYGQVVSTLGSAPTGTCCENDQCTEASDNTYMCSFTFTDPEYAMSMCPQKQSVCGTRQTVEFDDFGQTRSITTAVMTEGDSCTYKILSSKGAPAFKRTDTATLDSNNFEISFLEFDGEKVTKTDTEGTSAESSPAVGLPVRNQEFYDSGDQGNLNKGDQKKPPRRKLDGGMTDGESIDQEKEYLEVKEEKIEEEESGGSWFKISWGSNSDEKETNKSRGAPEEEDEDFDPKDEEWGGKPRPPVGERMRDTDAVEGYGVPTKGVYNAEQKGYKTFGSTGQGDNTEGVKDIADTDSSDRAMFVTVRAMANLGVDSI